MLPFAPHLAFAARDESFVANLEQCNGCGGCLKQTPTMCPTFVATGEEGMSTRGRANLIRAVLELRGSGRRSVARAGTGFCAVQLSVLQSLHQRMSVQRQPAAAQGRAAARAHQTRRPDPAAAAGQLGGRAGTVRLLHAVAGQRSLQFALGAPRLRQACSASAANARFAAFAQRTLRPLVSKTRARHQRPARPRDALGRHLHPLSRAEHRHRRRQSARSGGLLRHAAAAAKMLRPPGLQRRQSRRGGETGRAQSRAAGE